MQTIQRADCTPPGKLVKRIVAVASLALDGLDLVAHLLSGEVGGAALAVPEGDPRVPVVHHRLGLAETAVPARASGTVQA